MRRIISVPISASCDATNNTVPTTAPTKSLSGRIMSVKIKTPAVVDNTATIAVLIKDVDGDTIYSKSGVAVNTTNVELKDSNNVPLQIPVGGLVSINPTFSANQTTPRNVIVTLLIDSLL